MVAVSMLVCLCILSFGYQCRILLKRRQLERQTLDDLLAKLTTVNRDRLMEISDVYLHPTSQQLRVEPWQMWEAVGGLTGLNDLYRNASAMLDLAHYAERWNDETGCVLSEMMRRDAMRVKRAIFRLQFAYLLQFRLSGSPFHLQEAISSYCLLRERLLGMYSEVHIALVPRLIQAV